jgi:hypothetical protein
MLDCSLVENLILARKKQCSRGKIAFQNKKPGFVLKPGFF